MQVGVRKKKQREEAKAKGEIGAFTI